MRQAAVVALLLALAGCSEGGGQGEPQDAAGPTVEGWVVDERLTPIAGAHVRLAGVGLNATTDAQGHYAIEAPRGVDLVVVFEADGFLPQSRAAAADSGSRHVFNVTLERVPIAEPYDEVTAFEGLLRCGFVATTQEDPSRPHEHQGVRCSEMLGDTANRWLYEVPAGASGLVLEADWDPQSEVSQALVMKVVVADTGEVLGFTEGTPLVRVHVSSAKLEQNVRAGHAVLAVTMEPGAGTGNHEHGAVGAFVQQPFTVYGTAFFNGPVPPSYTVAER